MGTSGLPEARFIAHVVMNGTYRFATVPYELLRGLRFPYLSCEVECADHM